MATAKKFHREKDAYAGYRHAVEEEFGDALWYFTALCRRLDARADEIAGAAELVMGKINSVPVAIVRGMGHPVRKGSGRDLIRSRDKDLFR